MSGLWNIEHFVAPKLREFAAQLDLDDPLRVRLLSQSPPTDGEIASDFVSERLKTALAADAGQAEGDWFGPNTDIQPSKPSWYPTGALLAPIGQQLGPGARVLALIALDYVWVPLSVGAVYTYDFTIGLSRGEVWRFVSRDAYPTKKWVLQLDQPLSQAQVRAMYGDGAARRSLVDRDTVTLRITGNG
jgi:hypothetical protein